MTLIIARAGSREGLPFTGATQVLVPVGIFPARRDGKGHLEELAGAQLPPGLPSFPEYVVKANISINTQPGRPDSKQLEVKTTTEPSVTGIIPVESLSREGLLVIAPDIQSPHKPTVYYVRRANPSI